MPLGSRPIANHACCMTYPIESREQVLTVIEALRRAVELGATVAVTEEPMRGTRPSDADADFRRTVTFRINASVYDGSFPLPG